MAIASKLVQVGFTPEQAKIIDMAGSAGGVQTLGMSNLGNTSGTSGTINGSAIQFLFAGGNNVTLSQSISGSSGTITISAGAGGAAGSQSAGISNLGNTAGTSGIVSGSAVRLLIAGGNNITVSQSLNGASGTITISGPNTAAQTAESQSFGISNLGNTLGTSGIASGAQGRFLLAGGNNVTLSQSLDGASATVTISAGVGITSQSNQAAAGSNGSFTFQTLSFTNSNGLSLYTTTAGPGDSFIVGSYTVPTQTVESQSFGISNLGNTIGTSGIGSGAQGRFLLAGGNNVTLSQSINGASVTVTISGPNTAAQTVESQSLGISNLGNTSGTSGIASGGQVQLLIAGGNNITLSQSLNGASGTITISAANSAAQTAESQSFGISNLGNTSGTSGIGSGAQGRFLLAGGNNVTLSQSVNGASVTVTISAGAGGAGGSQTIGASNLGNTVGTSGVASGSAVLFAFAGGNNVTLSQSVNGASGTITISGPNTVAQTVESQSFGISNLGNTSGTSGVGSGAQGRFLLAGGNNITLSQSINGASVTVTISGGAGGAAGSQTVGISNLGNTSGTSGVASASGVQLILAGGNNITLSQSLNGASATVTISGAAGGAGGNQTLGISNLGNTSGTSGVATGAAVQFVLAGGNNITLSQSINGSSATVTISAAAPGGGAGVTLSGYEPFNLANPISTTFAPAIGSWYFQPFVAPCALASGRLNILKSFSNSLGGILRLSTNSTFASNTTGTRSVSYIYNKSVALYSRGAGANSTRLESFWSNQWSVALAQSVSVIQTNTSQVRATAAASITYIASVGSDGGYTTNSYANSGSFSTGASSVCTSMYSSALSSIINMLSGMVLIPIGFNTSIAAGQYWLAQAWSSASTTGGTSVQNILPQVNQAGIYGITSMGHRLWGLTVSNSSSQYFPGAGAYSAVSAVPPPTVNMTQLRSIASHITQYFNFHNSSVAI